jgi:hypothetical protein
MTKDYYRLSRCKLIHSLFITTALHRFVYVCLHEVYLHAYAEPIDVMAGAVLQHSEIGYQVEAVIISTLNKSGSSSACFSISI